MSVPVLNDIIQVKFSTWFDGQLGLNICNYKVTTLPGVGPTTLTIANAISASYAAIILPPMTTGAVYLGCSVRDLTPVPLPAADTSNVGAGPGTAGINPLPTQVCGLIKLTTAVAGRKGRGRKYIAFPDAANDSVPPRPDVGYQGFLANLAAFFSSAYTVGVMTMTPIIYHRLSKTGDLVVGAVVRDTWATQRRRGDLGRTNPQAIAL